MTIRLLPKSEIAKAQANAQKQTIDEGAKLARRIDSLRQTIADEERSLREFREKTVATIHKEISVLTARRDTITSELRKAERELEIAREPLDSEWDELARTKKEAELTLSRAYEKLKEAEADKEDASKAKKDIRRELERARTKTEEADKKLADAESDSAESKELRDEAGRIHSEAVRFEVETKKKLSAEETRLREWTESLLTLEEKINGEKRWLDAEKIRLSDREKTLERAFNRLKK